MPFPCGDAWMDEAYRVDMPSLAAGRVSIHADHGLDPCGTDPPFVRICQYLGDLSDPLVLGSE